MMITPIPSTFMLRHRYAAALPAACAGLALAGCCATAAVHTETVPAATITPAKETVAATTIAPATPSETWTNPITAPVGEKFPVAHGIFHAEPVSVTLNHLPEHRRVKVKFKLIVIGGWDGSNIAWGPDLWACRVRGGEQLVMSTFSNIGAQTSYYVQAYPDDFPWALHYAFTGGTPVADQPFAKPDPVSNMALADAFYPMEMWVPHTGESFTLDFLPMYDDDAKDNQHWAIADFEYATANEPVPLADGELETLWETLGEPDSPKANTAMWRLIAAGEPAAEFLIAKAKAMPRPDASLINTAEGLRIHRLQKALRILATPASRGVANRLTYKNPEYAEDTPFVSP